MPKLITEYIDYSNLDFLTESDENGKKSLMIQGPFIQSEIRNNNKRIYKKQIVEREVNAINESAIKEGRAWMGLDHPEKPTVTLKDACAILKVLKMDGNDAFGKAKVLEEHPNGRILKTCIDNGKPGVSTRGIGTVDKSTGCVNEDWKLITIDCVGSPSAPKAFIEGILESKEYIIGDSGDYVEIAVNQLQEQVDRDFSSKAVLGYMLNFINNIKGRI